MNASQVVTHLRGNDKHAYEVGCNSQITHTQTHVGKLADIYYIYICSRSARIHTLTQIHSHELPHVIRTLFFGEHADGIDICIQTEHALNTSTTNGDEEETIFRIAAYYIKFTVECV